MCVTPTAHTPSPFAARFLPDNQAIRYFPQGVMAFHITDSGNRFVGKASKACFPFYQASSHPIEAPLCLSLPSSLQI